MQYAQAIKFLISMIIMMNPLGSLTIFMQYTHRMTSLKRKKLARQTSVTIVVLMIGSIWLGEQILDMLDITISSFRVAGGIILLLIGFSMLQSRESAVTHTPEDDSAAVERESIAVVPMALPIIVGPGAISTLIIASNDFSTPIQRLYLSGLCGILALGMWSILYCAPKVLEHIGASVIKLITRIMGMIIMAIAIGMLAKGMASLFPGLQ